MKRREERERRLQEEMDLEEERIRREMAAVLSSNKF